MDGRMTASFARKKPKVVRDRISGASCHHPPTASEPELGVYAASSLGGRRTILSRLSFGRRRGLEAGFPERRQSRRGRFLIPSPFELLSCQKSALSQALVVFFDDESPRDFRFGGVF